MKTLKAASQYAIIFLFALLASSCIDEEPEDETTSFIHNSPRPDCLYHIDPNRKAWYETPVVVSPGWGTPVKLAEPLTDHCPNDAVEISRDGKTLYFYWSPIVNAPYDVLLHIHTGTYYAERTGNDPGVFSEPRFFDLQKGAKGGSVDGSMSFTPDGQTVYFHSTRIDNLGYQHSPPTDDYLDIYRAHIVNGEPGPAENLGEPVNSIYLDGEHALSPDGSLLYLTSNRPGGLGETDIWVTERTENAWTDPVNLGLPINSEHWEGQPGFAANHSETMYFVSNRDGPSSIYRTIHDGSGWSEPEMIITGYVGEPSLTSDGRIMYFVHVLVDDDGVFGSNIWYVRRSDL